ncbi:GreA/GreB family elongation factor [Ramlibacter alkalitolerans]|uniref:GreA/GreB family elongation factor n=1 Tax=Ramlibacter alkalitolerans TaxID=2039631 RepID=A0ABS1JT94_9BURK|nr:GreA/GreB family elongation factor [Ramlibacter alkalitolerans]MBL0427490.1 GreA/GreB family elongation factor [Ramlibacter alkalitolerans]
MRAPNCGERKLTELDYIRLKKFTAPGTFPELADILNEAELLPSRCIPPDVVTMNARFVIRDLKLQRRHMMAVCYPADAEPATGAISVLSPAGLGLLGLSVGAVARWVGPAGEETVAQIEGILFQPEATGDYVT